MTTFASFAEQLISERSKYIRGPAKEMNRWKVHCATALFAPMSIADIRPKHIIEWHGEMAAKRAADRRGDRPLSRATIERCSALVSVIFAEALMRDLVTSNPCTGIRPKKRPDEAATKDKRTFLTIEDQRAIMACDAIPEWDKRAMQFAWGTGLRQGEQCHLELKDIDVDGEEPFVTVRYGSKGLPPKSGKCRRVPLFGDGLEGARALIEFGKKVPNPEKLLYPSKTGNRRACGKPFGRGVKLNGRWTDPFHIHMRAAGVVRPGLVWHSLRHTCASSLVIGCWGDPWRLEEIQAMLGHATITQTQQYAHLGEGPLKAAAKRISAAQAAASPVANDAPAAAGSAPGCILGLFRGLISIVRRPVHREERAA